MNFFVLFGLKTKEAILCYSGTSRKRNLAFIEAIGSSHSREEAICVQNGQTVGRRDGKVTERFDSLCS